MKDPLVLCADATAGWHASWLTALGLRSTRDDDAWRALDRPHFIYFAGITLRAEASPKTVADAPGTVCDSWSTLDLSPFGRKVRKSEWWLHRPAGPLSAEERPAELELVRVTTPAEVEELEAVSVRGFENEDATVEPGTLHPAAVLADRRMTLWLGRVGGRPIGAAMSYRTGDVVGVFGINVVASARRRGYGTALTRAAALADTGLPSILNTNSAVAARIYERLGFRRVGELLMWVKGDPGP